MAWAHTRMVVGLSGATQPDADGRGRTRKPVERLEEPTGFFYAWTILAGNSSAE